MLQELNDTEWTKSELIHLVKRVMFGAKPADIAFFEKMTLNDVIESLLLSNSPPTPPLNNYDTADYQDPTGIKLGETWVNALYGDGTVNAKRRASLKAWWISLMVNQQRTIEEKMILFWHNHFVTEMDTVGDARYYYKYHATLRKYALGNFKEFVKAITLEPAMLRYLNGDKNTKTAPDENYGRELQELFTIGKGSGSKYTEDDVKAAARVLTGYRTDTITVTYTANANLHDSTDKKFSSFYKNTVIKGKTSAIEQELTELVNMIFDQEEVSKFICRKLYTFFVWSEISAEVEQNLILPLAKIFRENNYEIKPVLRALFKSAYFYETKIKAAMIKSPLDFLIGSLRQFSIQIPSANLALVEHYYFNFIIATQAANMQQDIGDPPNVAGWAAYYQAPAFYELWINTDTFPKRVAFTDTLILKGYTRNQQRMEVNILDFAKSLPNPSIPDDLINNSIEFLYQIDLSEATKAQIKKDILLSGQSNDYYWTEIWDTAINKPSDKNNLNLVQTKLKSLYQYLLSLPEYQLM